jgi:hypothetical protein
VHRDEVAFRKTNVPVMVPAAPPPGTTLTSRPELAQRARELCAIEVADPTVGSGARTDGCELDSLGAEAPRPGARPARCPVAARRGGCDWACEHPANSTKPVTANTADPRVLRVPRGSLGT